MAKLERIYTVPLGEAYEARRNKRVPKAVKLLRGFVTRHMKAEDSYVTISEALNKHLWKSSIQKPPRKVKIRVIKEEDTVRAYLVDEKTEAEKPVKKEQKKEEKAKEQEGQDKTAKKETSTEEQKKANEKKPTEKKAGAEERTQDKK